jgi:hypothetical protein
MVTVVLAVLFLGACTPGSRYEKKLKKELASGIRYDSLFMGMHLGMSDKDFYTLCWELNREGVIRQSHSNTSVEYHPGEKLDYPSTMTFYPNFKEGKIVEMPVQFSYDGWAPWNKKYSSAQLVEDIREWYEKEYGKGFIAVTHPLKGKAFIKIDGNRRITIYQEDDLYAWAIFTDMSEVSADDDDMTADSGEKDTEEPADDDPSE